MSLLSYNDLVSLVNQGVITNVKPEMINSTSIDLTLGSDIMWESFEEHHISIAGREPLMMKHYDLSKEAYGLSPGEFILAHSEQVFNLPNNISAEYKLKSSLARSGLEHLNAGWCDAGWNGSVLTLELKNMTQKHTLILKKGMPIGQIVFFSHLAVPNDRSYAARGRYNNDKTVHGIKA